VKTGKILIFAVLACLSLKPLGSVLKVGIFLLQARLAEVVLSRYSDDVVLGLWRMNESYGVALRRRLRIESVSLPDGFLGAFFSSACK